MTVATAGRVGRERSGVVLRPPRTTWFLDVGTAGLLAASTMVLGTSREAGFIGLLLIIAVALRSVSPVVSLNLGVVGALFYLARVEIPDLTVIAVPLIVYSCARWASDLVGRSALACGLAGAVLGPFVWLAKQDAVGLPEVVLLTLPTSICAVIITLAYAFGRRRRDASDADELATMITGSAADHDHLRDAVVDHPPRVSWPIDVGTAVVLMILDLLGTASGRGDGLVVAPWLALALAVRSNRPLLAMAIGALGAVLHLAVFDVPTLLVLAFPMIIYSVARWTRGPWARVALALGLVGAIAGPLRWLWEQIWFYGSPGDSLSLFVVAVSACSAAVLAAFAFGRRRRDADLAAQHRALAEAERVRHLQAERTADARISAVTERQRIARELHDIVAHSLSVIVVQAEGGKAIAAKRPELAADVLDTIAETGRDAMGEMRRIVGLLRSERESAEAYAPSPGVDDLQSLVDNTGIAELVVDGPLPRLSPALGLTIYRVVQESLTNVMKHAGPDARATVWLLALPDRLEITIRDDGGRVSDTVPLDSHPGNGLQGMRERLAVHGGAVRAHPADPGPGFVVAASVPLPELPAFAGAYARTAG